MNSQPFHAVFHREAPDLQNANPELSARVTPVNISAVARPPKPAIARLRVPAIARLRVPAIARLRVPAIARPLIPAVARLLIPAAGIIRRPRARRPVPRRRWRWRWQDRAARRVRGIGLGLRGRQGAQTQRRKGQSRGKEQSAGHGAFLSHLTLRVLRGHRGFAHKDGRWVWRGTGEIPEKVRWPTGDRGRRDRRLHVRCRCPSNREVAASDGRPVERPPVPVDAVEHEDIAGRVFGDVEVGTAPRGGPFRVWGLRTPGNLTTRRPVGPSRRVTAPAVPPSAQAGAPGCAQARSRLLLAPPG
jgi:hypothetical protein